MKNTKRSLMTSAVSLLLCFSMLLGTTYAWFTDSASSSGNIIQSGNLDVEMYWSEVYTTEANEWQLNTGDPIFTFDNWEPGYTDVKYVKIRNNGNLSFMWQLNIEAEGTMSDLADMINVYYINPISGALTTLNGRTSAGVLSDVVKEHKYTNGVLLPEGEESAEYPVYETVIAIALHMDETAGNKYQGTSLGCGFSVSLMATQFSYENDAFGNKYDEDSQWPNFVITGGMRVSKRVNVVDGKVSESVMMSAKDSENNETSAYVPEGVAVEEGKDKLTLTITTKDKSEANIVLDENEAVLPLDVHIDGVAADNTVPIKIKREKLLPTGLNMGNYSLYHVENGATVEMKLLEDGATPAHNDFEYDPVTGDVTLYIATFSEITLVADTENAWNGETATGFAGGDGTVENPYLIANADQLAYLGEVISNDNAAFGDKNYKLIADINLGGEENTAKEIIFYPIGYHKVGGTIATADVDDAPEAFYFDEDPDYASSRVNAVVDGDTATWYTYGGAFKGTFDGNGNTIKNIYQNTWQLKGNYDGNYWNAAMGIFGYVYGGTVKNLTVDNFSSDGEFTPTGVIAAYAANNATFENIAIINCNPRVYNTGNGGIVGIGGNTSDTSEQKLTFTNITVDNSNTISALWGSWDVACGGIMGMFRGNGLVHFENCHIGAQIDVYNDVCGNYQYYWYRYSGMVIGSIRKHTIDANGYTIPDTTGITAKACTVNFGEWNDYYYCELVANTLASYTHDHQFSRLTEIASLDAIKSGDTWTKTGNFLLNGECYHIVNKNGVLTRHLHEEAGYETVNGENVLKEDKQVVYLPFNQVFQGYGWGVMNIGFRSDSNFAFEGITIGDTNSSIDKFGVIVNGGSYEMGTTVNIGNIFKAVDGVSINANTLMVFVSPVGEDSTVSAVYTPNTSDWTKGTLIFSGIGAAKIVISDYTYCKEAVTSVTIKEPEVVDKFTAKDDLSFTHTLQGGSIDKTLDDIFSEIDGVKINYTNIKVEYSTTGDVTVEFVQNNDNWAASTVKFTGSGAVTFTINDQTYCNDATATVSIGHPANADKFTVKDALEYTAKNAKDTYKFTIGDLFTANVNEFVTDVVVTVNGVEYTFTKGEGWADESITLTEFGTFTVTITDNNYCNVASNTVTFKAPVPEQKFDVVMNNGDFLHRVGNSGTVALDKLFKAKDGVTVGTVSVTVEAVNGTSASGTYSNNAIQFNGTGVVKVTVTDNDYCISTELYLEVVDATNLTSAIGTTTGGNFVLLCDVNTANYVNYWNCTLYGNGFTYSLKGAPTAYNSKQGKGILITKNAVLDNIVIVGDVYNGYGAFTENDYYNTAIDVTGDTTIQNCYISGCSAPIRARNNVTIINTTLYGGAVANLIIEDGTVTLEDVTTANYDDGRALVGMGIVIHSDATEAAKLVLNGTLTQYNFISESKVPTDTYAKNLHNAMFGDDCYQYHFGDSPKRYVNTGIISLTSTFNGEDITDNAKTGYVGKSLRVSSYDGYVYTQPNTSGSVNNNCPEYKPTTQGAVPPSYKFDYTNKNYVAKTDGSNDYCYEENGKVNISMDEGDTFNWDTSILTIGKGITNYTVSMNGTDYTGKSIAFNTAGDYTVTYTYTDANNYKLDENGNTTTYSATYTKTVNITVAVVKATTKHAEFTFGSSNTASTTVTIGNNTYVMPDVSGTSSTIGSTTVSGQTIYYPIVEIIMSDGKTSHTSGWYAYFPVFSGAVTITDYANNGTGDKMTPYNGSTTTMPSGLSVVGDAKTLFKYQSGSNAGESPVVKNNKLVYSSAKIEAKRSEYNTVIQYSYTDNAGATYYYYIGYHAPAQSYTSCVTPDTLVTLADGTQKRIDEVTYADQLLVWNFYTGSYDVASSSIVMNHGYSTVNVTSLNFADGTTVKTINGHGFFDVATNEFVLIDEFNAADYIGHSFVKQNGNGYSTTELVSYSVETQYTEVWSILTAEHYNCMLEGMWTITAAEVDNSPEWLMPYEIGEDMKYDEEKMQADIEKYGLYTYDDFAKYCTYEEFVAFGFENFKVSVEKGYITWDEILYLIGLHIG